MSANGGWVALLRAINVGGRNVVPMAELRRVFEEAGCSGVATYIQSGNAVFAHPEPDRVTLARLLERAVAAAFGVSAAVVLRTPAEIGAVARSHPFGPDTSRVHVAFLASEADGEAAGRLAALDAAPDRALVAGSEVYLEYPNGAGGARLTAALLERHLGVAATVRNWRTVTRLAEMADTKPLS